VVLVEVVLLEEASLRRRRRFLREEEYSSSLKSSGVPIPHPPGYNCVDVSCGGCWIILVVNILECLVQDEEDGFMQQLF